MAVRVSEGAKEGDKLPALRRSPKALAVFLKPEGCLMERVFIVGGDFDQVFLDGAEHERLLASGDCEGV